MSSGLRPSDDAQVRQPFFQFVVGQLVERLAGQDDGVGGVDRGVAAVHQPDIVADGAGRFDVVAGNHFHFNASPPTLLHRLLHVLAQRIADGHESDKDEVLFQRFADCVQGILGRQRLRRQDRVTETQRAHRFRRRVTQSLLHVRPIGRRQFARFAVAALDGSVCSSSHSGGALDQHHQPITVADHQVMVLRSDEK